MKYLIFMLISSSIFASYPHFRVDDEVTLIHAGNEEHYFRRCENNGKVTDFEKINKNYCTYQYMVWFSCGDNFNYGYLVCDSNLKLKEEE